MNAHYQIHNDIMDGSQLCQYTLLLRPQLPQSGRASESIFWGQENFLIISTTIYILHYSIVRKYCHKDYCVMSFTWCFHTKVWSTVQFFLDISPKSSGLALVFLIANVNIFTVAFLYKKLRWLEWRDITKTDGNPVILECHQVSVFA